MHFVLLAVYAGPDQIMTVGSGLAGLLGILLIFWNKVVAGFFKVVRIFHRGGSSRSSAPASVQTPRDTPKSS